MTAVGVAAGAAIFIYKNMRAFFKYTLPELELNQIEKEAWIHSREENFDFENLADVLTTLRYQQGIPLSQRSRIFLNLPNADERAAYARANHVRDPKSHLFSYYFLAKTSYQSFKYRRDECNEEKRSRRNWSIMLDRCHRRCRTSDNGLRGLYGTSESRATFRKCL